MTKTLTIINQKGGVAKTSTAEAIGTGLALLHNKRILFIDTDPQGNLTFALNAEFSGKITVAEVLKAPTLSKLAIQEITDKIHIIPASPELASAEKTLTEIGREYKLREALEPIKENYDYIIIDTPPTLSVLTANALTASDSCIIPTMADMFSLNGIQMLYNTINVIRTYANPGLLIDGILLTKYNKRTLISQEVAKALNRAAISMGTKIFETPIRECNALREAQLQRRNIYEHAPRSNAANDYSRLIDEFLNGGE